ncbi:MAG: hypothetical protein EOO88_06010 [Pedobacter sp.]|nr:MAG: hypothetical protein EOO88_06010 [Pedobacter sp.]
MENQENKIEKDEIINPEQFNVGRAPQEEKEIDQNDMTERADDAGYTPQEEQFADGKGTQLNEQLGPDREEISDELQQEVEGTFEDQDFGKEQTGETKGQ